MAKQEKIRRFSPEQWVMFVATGENVKVESWSDLAHTYRVRSRKRGLQFATEDELEELKIHPEVHLGRHWSRCRAPGCGAPLTPGLPICPQCGSPTCACGRCQCSPTKRKLAPGKTKAATAKAAPKKKAAKTV